MLLQGVPEKLFRKCCSALATSYSAAVMKVNLFVLYIDHSTFLLPTWLGNRCWEGRQVRARSEMSFCAVAWAKVVLQSQLEATRDQCSFLEAMRKKYPVPNKQSASSIKGRCLCYFNGRACMASLAITILLDLP